MSRTDVMSHHGMTVRRRIAPGDEMLQLSLDVGEQRARPEAEEIGLQPAVAELVLHEVEILERVLGRTDPAGRLVAYGVARLLEILADHPHHDEAERQRRVHAF